MGSKSTINVLIVDQAITFGGSIVVMANIANNFGREFRCSIIYEFSTSIADFLFSDKVKKHRVRNVIDYQRSARTSVWIESFENKILRKLLAKLFVVCKYLASFYQVTRIARIIYTDHIDIVHSNNSREAIIAARLLKRKIVLHLHGIGNAKKDPVRDNADVYLAISELVAKQAIDKHYDKDKIIVLANPVVEKNTDQEKVAIYKEKFGIEDSDKVFGMVGRIIQWKGQLQFLEAARIVVAKMNNVKILVIGDISDGDEDYLDEVKARIKSLGLQDQVVITGYIQDVHNVMATLDLLVHCSIEPEPFGLVITEAMSMDIPVIAGDIGAPPEIIESGKTGYIVSPFDAQKIAKYITDIFSNENLAQKIRFEAKKVVAKKYNIHNYMAELTNIYKSLLQE